MLSDLLDKHQVKVRFVLVGIWNVLFAYLVFYGFLNLFSSFIPTMYIAYMLAIFLSNIVAIINSFILHKYITFKSRRKGVPIIIEFFKFVLTYLITFCLSMFLLPFLVEVFHIPPKISGALLIPICAVINYLGASKIFLKASEIRAESAERY